MKITNAFAPIMLLTVLAVPAFAETLTEQNHAQRLEADNASRASLTEPAANSELYEYSVPQTRQDISDAAAAVEKTTDLAAIACGIAPANGLAAVPCLAAQGINLLSAGVSWIFGK